MNGIKRGFIIGMTAIQTFSAINMSVAAESERPALIRAEKLDETIWISEPTTPPVRVIPNVLNIQIFFGDKKITLERKPFMGPENEVYVPLREILGKLGYDDANSFIRWNDGTIDVGILDIDTTYLYRIKIGNENMQVKRADGNVLSSIDFTSDEVNMSISNGLMPILFEDNTYVAISDLNYMLYGYTNKRNPETNAVYELEYTMHDQNGNNWYSHTTFRYRIDENENYYVALSDYWNGKIEKVAENGVAKCYHKEIREKYDDGMGLLFYIEKNTTGVDPITSGQTLIAEIDGYKYIFGIPTDVQHPTNTTAEGKRLQEEYLSMTKDLEFIKNSFSQGPAVDFNYTDKKLTLNDSVFVIEQGFNGGYERPALVREGLPTALIEGFLDDFKNSDFESMKNYCTLDCIKEFFGDNEVYGIKSSNANLVSYPVNSDGKLQDTNIIINADITPAPKSHFKANEKKVTFNIHLIKKADGTYLIDSFSK